MTCILRGHLPQWCTANWRCSPQLRCPCMQAPPRELPPGGTASAFALLIFNSSDSPFTRYRSPDSLCCLHPRLLLFRQATAACDVVAFVRGTHSLYDAMQPCGGGPAAAADICGAGARVRHAEHHVHAARGKRPGWHGVQCMVICALRHAHATDDESMSAVHAMAPSSRKSKASELAVV